MLAVYVLGYPVILYVLIRLSLQVHRTSRPGRCLSFYITDYWVAVVGLTPTFVLIAMACDAIKSVPSVPYKGETAVLAGYAVGLGQVAGMIIARAWNQIEDESAWIQAGQILVGAVFGIALPIIAMALISLTIVVLISAALTAPISIPFWLLGKWSQSRTSQLIDQSSKSR